MLLEKPVVLTNLSSSSSEEIGGRLASFFERYGYERPLILTGESSDMKTMMERMREAKGDILIAYGGDGTSAAVASIAREQGVPFVSLPGGTMNMLMKGLYGSDDWEVCLLKALSCAKPRPMTAGVVSDDRGERGRFMVGCMFGQPTKMSEAREELRDGKVGEAVSGALEAMRQTKETPPLYFALEDGEYDGRPLELLNVTCPFMDGEALDPNVLDVTLFETVTGGSTLSLGLAALMGNLRQSEEVDHVKTKSFRLRADYPIRGLLDGEAHEFEGEVRVELDTDSGLVLAPQPAFSFPLAANAEVTA